MCVSSQGRGAPHLVALAVVLEAARALAAAALGVPGLDVPQLPFPNFWLERFRISVQTCLQQEVGDAIRKASTRRLHRPSCGQGH